MSNKAYDILKKVSLMAVPLVTLITALTEIWGWQYGAEICATISANGNDIDVAAYEKVDVNVASSGKAVQIDNTNHRIASTSYVNTGAEITVEKAGTYTVYYSAFRSSTSGTSGTQLYKNGVAQGSVNTTWQNSYCQTPHTTMSLAVGDVITVYARSRGTSYYTCVSDLTIIEQ